MRHNGFFQPTAHARLGLMQQGFPHIHSLKRRVSSPRYQLGDLEEISLWIWTQWSPNERDIRRGEYGWMYEVSPVESEWNVSHNVHWSWTDLGVSFLWTYGVHPLVSCWCGDGFPLAMSDTQIHILCVAQDDSHPGCMHLNSNSKQLLLRVVWGLQ